jgi:NifU-like protein involved in Fe-S cluster formation
MKCQAREMDRDHFENPRPVPPCDQFGEVPVQGYVLCPGCADALHLMVQVGNRALIQLGGKEIRRALE